MTFLSINALNWIEPGDPGGVNWTTLTPLSKEKSASSRQPSPCVECLGAVDVRNGDHDHLKLQVTSLTLAPDSASLAETSWCSFLYEVAVKPGQLDELRTLMSELVDSAQTETGALVYEWSLSDDEVVAHVDERYADSSATLPIWPSFARRSCSDSSRRSSPFALSYTARRARRSRRLLRRPAPFT